MPDERSPLPQGPDADIQEQRQPVDRDSGGEPRPKVTRDPEAPEADAYEQAQEVPLPPEDEID